MVDGRTHREAECSPSYRDGPTRWVMNPDVVFVLVSVFIFAVIARGDLGVRESVSGMENVILSIGASIVMLYLIIALIRPEWF